MHEDDTFYLQFCKDVDRLAEDLVDECKYFAEKHNYELCEVVHKVKIEINKKLKELE